MKIRRMRNKVNSARTKRAVKAATDEGNSFSVNTKIIDILEADGFESASGYGSGKFIFDPEQPYWDKDMWLRFGCTYDAIRGDAYIWWDPNGNAVDLNITFPVKNSADAESLCDQLYDWDEYNIDELLEIGLPLIGAEELAPHEYEYRDGDDVAYINTGSFSGTVTDAYGETTSYNNMQDLLEAAGIIR